jgi:YbbR domain-containing protein
MLKSFFLIFFSLILSCFFWLGIVSTEQNIKTFNQNIHIQHFNIPENIFASSGKQDMSITVDADKEILNTINMNNFEVFINLSDMNIGESIVPITIKSPMPEIRIVSYHPKETLVKLEEIQEKTIPITLEIQGSTSKDYRITEKILNTQNAIVYAGESILNDINDIKAIITLQGETNNIQKKVELIAFNSQNEVLKTIKVEPPEVEVSLILSQITDTKNVGIKTNFIGNIKKDNIYIQSINIAPNISTLRGKKYILNKVDFIHTEEIDITNITESESFRVKIIAPIGTEIIGKHFIDVRVEIKSILPEEEIVVEEEEEEEKEKEKEKKKEKEEKESTLKK